MEIVISLSKIQVFYSCIPPAQDIFKAELNKIKYQIVFKL